MGRKIFISYKYSDASVQQARDGSYTTVRDYVDALQNILDREDHINKGEDDGEDLSNFKDEYIESTLRPKIFDSSITIVLISPNMKDTKPEDDQWIPWEIAYSLKKKTREGKTSHPNAILAIVLPDRYGSYDYYVRDNRCCSTNCTTWQTSRLFNILSKNMFNKRNCETSTCIRGTKISYGEPSYILSEKWENFCKKPNHYIERAVKICENISAYDLIKTV